MPVLVEELAHLEKTPTGEGGHRWQVSCLDFSPDGSQLASGSWDKEVRIWNLSSLETEYLLKGVHKIPITSLSWHRPEGKLLCVGSADGTATLWDTFTGTHVGTMADHDGWVLDVSFSIASTTVATASWDNLVRLWDSETCSVTSTLKGHEKGVWSVDYKPNVGSSVLCSGSEDGSIKLWDSRTKPSDVRTFKGGQPDPVYCVKWSPDGAMIASGSDNSKVSIWEPRSGALINTIEGHVDTVKSVFFNPQTVNVSLPVLASAGGYIVHLSDPRSGRKSDILSLMPHEPGKEVEAVTISPDGSLLVSGGRDGKIALMTLMVPRLLPYSQEGSAGFIKRRAQPISSRLFIKDYGYEDEDQDEVEEVDDFDDEYMQSEMEHKIAHWKRKTRGREKDVELSDHSTVKKTLNARSSRRNRIAKKNIDISAATSHLLKGKSIYDVDSDADDVEEEDIRPPPKPMPNVLRNFTATDSLSSDMDDEMTQSSFSGTTSSFGRHHHSMLDHLDSSIMLTSKQPKKVPFMIQRNIENLHEASSMSGISVGSESIMEDSVDDSDEHSTSII
jgi:WD40 repeat protein